MSYIYKSFITLRKLPLFTFLYIVNYFACVGSFLAYISLPKIKYTAACIKRYYHF